MRSIPPTVCGGSSPGARRSVPPRFPIPTPTGRVRAAAASCSISGAWYAQAHPTEDFAETFAVWLKPHSPWRREYVGWPAYAKLQYIDRLVQEIGEQKPLISDRSTIEDVTHETGTLREHYEQKLARYRLPRRSGADELLLKVFTDGAAH